jgi:hypothetical protein
VYFTHPLTIPKYDLFFPFPVLHIHLVQSHGMSPKSKLNLTKCTQKYCYRFGSLRGGKVECLEMKWKKSSMMKLTELGQQA